MDDGTQCGYSHGFSGQRSHFRKWTLISVLDANRITNQQKHGTHERRRSRDYIRVKTAATHRSYEKIKDAM
ncbi:unnamed protein product [Calypogeia fissa]